MKVMDKVLDKVSEKVSPAAPTVPRVLVMMATYNGGKWLEQQIDSILAQEDVEISLIVADDASSDGTQAFVAALAQRDKRLRLLVWPTGSGSAGANFRRIFRSVDSAGYDFVALADQDDIWHPRKLATATAALARTGNHGYSCAVRSFWPDGREKTLNQVPVPRATDFLFEGAGQGCTFVVRQALFARARAFCLDHSDEVERLHYHDWLLYLLARGWGLGWYFDQTPWIRYRQHGGNEIGSRGGLKSIFRRLELIRSGWFGGQVRAALDIFKKIEQNDPLVNKFSKIFCEDNTFLRRLKLLFFFSRHGRRRGTDRAVLAASAAAGWI